MTHWTVAHKVPLFMGFPRQEWLLLQELFLTETEPRSPTLAGGFFTTESPRKPSFSLASCYRENLRSAMHALPVTLPSRNVSTHTPFLTVFPSTTENGLSLLPKARPQPPLLPHRLHAISLPQPTAFFQLLNVLQVLLLDLRCPHLCP